jgi:hypothetical protein
VWDPQRNSFPTGQVPLSATIGVSKTTSAIGACWPGVHSGRPGVRRLALPSLEGQQCGLERGAAARMGQSAGVHGGDAAFGWPLRVRRRHGAEPLREDGERAGRDGSVLGRGDHVPDRLHLRECQSMR